MLKYKHEILYAEKKHIPLCVVKTMCMEKMEINIYEAKELLYNMLNVEGFNKRILGKSKKWTYSKYDMTERLDIRVGYNDDDILLMNKGLMEVAEFCNKRVLKLPSECNDSTIYAAYVSKQLKELRGVIKLPYLREKYTSMAQRTFNCKLNSTPNRHGKPNRFSDNDIVEINNGIKSFAEIFSSITLTL